MEPIAVIGIPVSGPAALDDVGRKLIAQATVIASGRRHLSALTDAGLINPVDSPRPAASRLGAQRTIVVDADLGAVGDQIEAAREAGERVAVAATGDPGFFGIGRWLAGRFGASALLVRPAPSCVAVAFARLGLPWDDAVVASAHGRPFAEAIAIAAGPAKAAVLASPSDPAERICGALAAAVGGGVRGAVLSDLGAPTEQVTEGTLAELAAGTFPPLSVVVLIRGTGVPEVSAIGWRAAEHESGCREQATFGRDEREFEHRDGMVTKPEVRAVVLSRLDLPSTGVLWDVGAGSGSIGIEAASLEPRLTVYAIERNGEDAARIGRNALRHQVRLAVVTGEAPEALRPLPDPDRVVVGGGGTDVLDAVLSRLADRGRVVATFAGLGRAAAGAERLGNLTEVVVNRGRRLPDGAFRLVGGDPVFVCWGPS